VCFFFVFSARLDRPMMLWLWKRSPYHWWKSQSSSSAQYR